MGWVRVFFLDGSTPEWAAELNEEADLLDTLGDDFPRTEFSKYVERGEDWTKR